MLDGTSGDVEERRGGSSSSSSDSYTKIKSTSSFWPFWHFIFCSPSAVMQVVELHSALTQSMACSLVVALSPALIPGLTGYTLAFRLCDCGLGSGSGVDPARSSSGQIVSGESIPQRQRISPEDHLRMTMLCTLCSGWCYRKYRVRHPSSW